MASSIYRPSEIRRNYLLLVAEGILFTVGIVFFDPNTVLPLLMDRLTGSVLLVGLVGAIQPLMKGTVPILAGNWVSSLSYKKGFLVGAVSIGRLPLWVLGIALILIPNGSPAVWAGLLLLVQLLFWFGDSAGDPAWMDMVGKSVPNDRRGRFFATRQVVGGGLSVLAGAAVAAILQMQRLPFPTNYGVVICIGAVIYLANVATFLPIVERPSRTTTRHRLIALIRRLPHFLRANPTFARTMIVLVLVSLSRLSLPFFIVYGKKAFGLTEAALVYILPLQIGGRIVGAVLWGFLGDRFGHHRGIQGVTLASTIPSLVAVVLSLLVSGSFAVAAFSFLFFVLGFALEGFPPFINYMLDIVSEDDRPLYAGLMSVGFVPAALAPIIGGIIIQHAGYLPLFAVTSIVAVAGSLAAFTLPNASQRPAEATEARR